MQRHPLSEANPVIIDTQCPLESKFPEIVDTDMPPLIKAERIDNPKLLVAPVCNGKQEVLLDNKESEKKRKSEKEQLEDWEYKPKTFDYSVPDVEESEYVKRKIRPETEEEVDPRLHAGFKDLKNITRFWKAAQMMSQRKDI